MYKFVDPKTVKYANGICMNMIHDVQKIMSDYFTFDIKLIGSGERRLVTQNADEPFDLDYNLIIQRDKQGIINNPEKVKSIFIDAFNEVSPKMQFKSANDSTSVIKERLIIEGKLTFSFDAAIIIEDNRGVYCRLVFDKDTRRYFWNEVKGSKNQASRFEAIKEAGHFPKFKNRYLEKKNIYLSRGIKMHSYSVFLEVLNEM